MAQEGTYWTCFAYEGLDPSVLHCTHKFLGLLTPEQVEEITAVLDLFFSEPVMAPCVVFEQEDWFGPDRDCRVLRPTGDVRRGLLPELKEMLDGYRVDDYGNYKPHVSTDTEKIIRKPLTRYCLLRDDEILAEYELSEVGLPVPDVRQQFPYDCGAAATLSVLQYFGVGPQTESEVLEGLGTTEDGTDPQAMCRYLGLQGLMIDERDRLQIYDLQKSVSEGCPVICCIQDWGDSPSDIVNQDAGHWVVVVRADEDWVTYHDPNEGLNTIPAVDFLGRWDDYAGAAPFGDSDQRYVHYGIAVKPPGIAVVGPPTTYQADVDLITLPVGKDWDGVYRPIHNLMSTKGIQFDEARARREIDKMMFNASKEIFGVTVRKFSEGGQWFVSVDGGPPVPFTSGSGDYGDAVGQLVDAWRRIGNGVEDGEKGVKESLPLIAAQDEETGEWYVIDRETGEEVEGPFESESDAERVAQDYMLDAGYAERAKSAKGPYGGVTEEDGKFWVDFNGQVYGPYDSRVTASETYQGLLDGDYEQMSRMEPLFSSHSPGKAASKRTLLPSDFVVFLDQEAQRRGGDGYFIRYPDGRVYPEQNSNSVGLSYEGANDIVDDLVVESGEDARQEQLDAFQVDDDEFDFNPIPPSMRRGKSADKKTKPWIQGNDDDGYSVMIIGSNGSSEEFDGTFETRQEAEDALQQAFAAVAFDEDEGVSDAYLQWLQGKSTSPCWGSKYRVNAGGGIAAVGSDVDGWRLFDSDGMSVTDLTFGSSDDAVQWAQSNKSKSRQKSFSLDTTPEGVVVTWDGVTIAGPFETSEDIAAAIQELTMGNKSRANKSWINWGFLASQGLLALGAAGAYVGGDPVLGSLLNMLQGLLLTIDPTGDLDEY